VTPEGKIKQALKKALSRLPSYYRFAPVQSGLGATTLDYLCCINSKFVAIETKAPGKQLTVRQQATKEQIERAGGLVYVVDSVEGAQQLSDLLGKLCQ
jgi:hypothetical protein